MNRALLNIPFMRRIKIICRSVCASMLLVAAMSAAANAEISLELALVQERAYTGESVPVTVILRIADETVRNIGYPRLAAPGGGTVAFTPPIQDTDAKDQRITQYKFTGRISGVKPGSVTVGPVKLECEVMQPASGSAAFFGGQEPRSIKLVSATAPLEILPLPATGKPASFSGAIGGFSMSVKTVPPQVAVGEPVTITTTIQGAGSLTGANCPKLVDPAMRSFPVKAMRSAARLICEQVIMPNKAITFPPAIWSYFDPKEGVYRVLSGDVKSTIIARTQTPVAKTALPTHSSMETRNYVSSEASSLPPGGGGLGWRGNRHENKKLQLHPPPNSLLSREGGVRLINTFARGLTSCYFLMAMAGVLLLSVLALLMRKRFKPAPVTTVSEPSSELQEMLRDAEEAASNGDVGLFYDIVFAITQKCVEKFYSEPSAFQQLSNLPVKDEKLNNINEIKKMIVACDKVRYGRIMPDNTAMSADLEKIRRIFYNTL